MIVVCGDSWGCGCWTPDSAKLYHKGLEQFLHDDGHKVINISRPGTDLVTITTRLQNFLFDLEDPPLWFTEPVTKIFVLQTEWHRQIFKVDDKPEYHQYKNKGDDQKIIARFYGTLSYIAEKFNVPVNVIGGCSDTIWLDDFEKYYPGVNIVCQSFTNLLVNDNHRTDEPVYSVKFPKDFITDYESMQKAEQGQKREQVWNDNPQWFFPDGIHPNHLAFEVLYAHLKKEKVI